jgi:protocatechuate 3,4-dioxygenase, beta subunit
LVKKQAVMRQFCPKPIAMNKFVPFAAIVAAILFSGSGCTGQQGRPNQPRVSANSSSPIGGGCESCELMFEGMPDSIPSTVYSPGWTERGQRLQITGRVLQPDGKTPAAGVTLYFWQTDHTGRYTPAPGLSDKARPHGHIRGWVRSDSNGRYSLYTIRPAPYPRENIAAHIHLVVKEPGLEQVYYIDDMVFDDDPLLIPQRKKNPFENRGGSGLLRILLKDSLQVAERDIILGLHIPHYPVTAANGPQSGLSIGEDSPSFMPFHAYGPDKGSRACPVCKYGRYLGILYFVGNHPNWEEIKKWWAFLEAESEARGQYLKAYFVYGNEYHFNATARRTELEGMGKKLGLQRVALCFVPSLNDSESEVHLNRINPQVGNTFVIYKHRRIIDKYIDLAPTPAHFTWIQKVLNNSTDSLFELKEPAYD